MQTNAVEDSSAYAPYSIGGSQGDSQLVIHPSRLKQVAVRISLAGGRYPRVSYVYRKGHSYKSCGELRPQTP